MSSHSTSEEANDPRGASRASLDDGWWAMATFDGDGRVLDLNVSFADLLGRRRDELLGSQILDHVDADGIATEMQALARLRAGEPILRYRGHLPLPDGSEWQGEILLSMVPGATRADELIHLRLMEDGRRRPPDRIAWREGDFPLALDAMRVGVAILGLDGIPLQVNRALCRITGRTEDELLAMDLLSLAHPDDRELDVELGTRAWMGEFDSYTIEKRLVRPDGDEVWVQQEVTFARDQDGVLLHLIGQVIDISDRKEVELELARSREELARLVDQVPVGLMRSDAVGRIITANPAVAAIAGYDELPRGFPMADTIHRGDMKRLGEEMAGPIAERRDYHVEFRVVRPDGEVRWVRSDSRPEFDADGELVALQGTWFDVTELKAAEDELRRYANDDALTGLCNRRMVFDGLTQAIHRCEADPERSSLTVLFVDLDGFKVVNDDHGHGVGDDVLRQIAGRLGRAVEGIGEVGRFGGDEFVAWCNADIDSGCQDESRGDHDRTCEDLADRVIEAVAEPIEIGPGDLLVGASIGIARWHPGDTADDLINAADRGVYEAKRRGRNRWYRT